MTHVFHRPSLNSTPSTYLRVQAQCPIAQLAEVNTHMYIASVFPTEGMFYLRNSSTNFFDIYTVVLSKRIGQKVTALLKTFNH
jgi:hypothetical protein